MILLFRLEKPRVSCGNSLSSRSSPTPKRKRLTSASTPRGTRTWSSSTMRAGSTLETWTARPASWRCQSRIPWRCPWSRSPVPSSQKSRETRDLSQSKFNRFWQRGDVVIVILGKKAVSKTEVWKNYRLLILGVVVFDPLPLKMKVFFSK